MERILKRRHWIFDMDGTLTVAKHDFLAIREALGIDAHLPILEAINAMPEDLAREKRRKLDEMEREVASRSTPMPGAAELLATLYQRGDRLGILTRNNSDCAEITLSACGFDHYFEQEHVLHRDSCPPKPEPDGVHKLLDHWGADASDAVMVGDYLFDLQSGRRAGSATIYIDTEGEFPWAAEADICIAHLSELLPIA